MTKDSISNIQKLIFITGVITLGFVVFIFPGKKTKLKKSNGPWEKTVKLNSLGFRDIEHKIKANDEVLRIAILGDSTAYGIYLDNQEHIYPRKVESLLNQSYKKIKFEVFNFSKPGWGSGDEFHSLINLGIKYKPDLVFVGYWPNDIPILRGVPQKYCQNPLDNFLRKNFKSIHNTFKNSKPYKK